MGRIPYPSCRKVVDGIGSGFELDRQLQTDALEIVELALDGRPPCSQVGFEVFAITFFEGMFQLVEGLVLGIEKGSIPSEEVVVDHLGQRHAAYPRVQTMICAAYPLEPMPRSRPKALSAAQIAGLLAEDDRLRVVAALALGASTEEAVIKATGIDTGRLRLAIGRLASGGLVVIDADGGLRLEAELFKQAAREAAGAKRR